MLVIIIFNKYMNPWVKAAMTIYYAVIAVWFVTVSEKMYSDHKIVSYAHLVNNSKWVDNFTHLLFWPFLIVLFYCYAKWFGNAKTRIARVLIWLSLIPSLFLVLVFFLMFSFYGYTP